MQSNQQTKVLTIIIGQRPARFQEGSLYIWPCIVMMILNNNDDCTNDFN